MKDSPKFLASLIGAGFLVWLIYYGWIIAHVALADSDSCWLLAMGRWIVEHQRFPTIDPFSQSVTAYAQSCAMPLVQYQWLAEICFYGIYKAAGLIGLMSLVTIISSCAFLVLPYLAFVKRKCLGLLSLALLVGISWLASFCLYLRPQIFSFLFLSILIYWFLPTTNIEKRGLWKHAIVLFVIMLLWVNTHIFFPLGIVFLPLILSAKFLDEKLGKARGKWLFYLAILPLVGFVSTVFNPWGVDIWRCVWQLLSHGSSSFGTEMAPINLLEWDAPITWAFVFLLILYALFCYLYKAVSIKGQGILPLILGLVAILLSLRHCKLVPITALLIYASCLEVLSRSGMRTLANLKVFSSCMRNINEVEALIWQAIQQKIYVVVILFVLPLMGALLHIVWQPLELPQASKSFKPPFEAIEFLKVKRPVGKVFNDPNFGSMMCWYLEYPKVFFDTRFSAYEPERMIDTLHIKNCDPGWEQLWAKYNCDWAFIRTSVPLAQALRKWDWQAVYADNKAVILIKPK